MKSTTLYAGLSLVLSSMIKVEAHITMWNNALFGYNWPYQAWNETQEYNNNIPVAPLRGFDNLTVDEWFARGLLNFPPIKGDFMELPSGGRYTAELACNRAWTTMRDPRMKDEPLETYACPDVAPMHTMLKMGKKPDNKWLGGTAIGIAYTSDEHKVKPNDFTIISVNYTSVWYRETVYQIPSNMPPCPSGGCLCTWNWWHLSGNGEGYGKEFYNTLYRCKITGQTSNDWVIPLGSAQSPQLCSSTKTLCNKGPKQALYAYLVSGMNILPEPDIPPTYNARYGFADGAQNDILVTRSSGSGVVVSPSISTLACSLFLVILLLTV